MAFFGNRIAQKRIDLIVSLIEDLHNEGGHFNVPAGDDAVTPIIQALHRLRARQSASTERFKEELEEIVRNVLNGNLTARAVTEAMPPGDRRRAYEGINAILDAVSGPLTLTSNYIDQLGRGVMPENINIDYKGEYSVIRDNLNGLIGRMRDLLEQADTQAQEFKGR